MLYHGFSPILDAVVHRQCASRNRIRLLGELHGKSGIFDQQSNLTNLQDYGSARLKEYFAAKEEFNKFKGLGLKRKHTLDERHWDELIQLNTTIKLWLVRDKNIIFADKVPQTHTQTRIQINTKHLMQEFIKAKFVCTAATFSL